MLLPACTGLGDAVLVTARLGPLPPTMVVTRAVLLEETGSLTDEATSTVPVMIVPFAVPPLTFTTSVNVPEVEPAILEALQTTLPVPPTAGVRQLHPLGATME